MTLHTLDPLPPADGQPALICYRCDVDAVGLVDEYPVCAEHTPDACEKCGKLVLIGQHPLCGRSGPSGHGWIDARDAQRFDPVVVHYNPATQSYRFPGAMDAVAPAGFERREIRTMGEVRRFQKHWNETERKRVDAKVCKDQAYLAYSESINRPVLRQAMQHFSPQMRDFANYVIQRNNDNRPKTFDPGCHLEAFEMDRSNREAHRDVRTGWRGRK